MKPVYSEVWVAITYHINSPLWNYTFSNLSHYQWMSVRTELRIPVELSTGINTIPL